MLKTPGEFKTIELKENGILLGYIMARHPICTKGMEVIFEIIQAQKKIVFLYLVFTNPAYRNKGIAKRLIKTFIDWAIAEGYLTIFLDVLPDEKEGINKEKLISLYSSFGFVTAGINSSTKNLGMMLELKKRK